VSMMFPIISVSPKGRLNKRLEWLRQPFLRKLPILTIQFRKPGSIVATFQTSLRQAAKASTDFRLQTSNLELLLQLLTFHISVSPYTLVDWILYK
jgi:hypothetical protein